MTLFLRVIPWFVLAVLVACGDAAVGDDPPDEISVGTFNTGLVAVVKGVDARRAAITEELQTSAVDVLCLQELFDPIDIADFASALADNYPHSHYSELGESAVGNGLLLLSRYPLEATEELLFVAADPLGLTDRMVIAADVVLGDERIHVMCSHLQAGLEPEGTTIRSEQVDEIVEFAGEQGYLDGPSILLGDFNLGPDPVGACTVDSDPPCLAPDVTTYAKVLETFDDPAADWDQCTQCRDVFLPLQQLSTYVNEPDQRIDHCFTRALDAWEVTATQTLFDEAVSLEVDVSGGTETLTSLSDHIGVRCTLARTP